MIDSTWADRRAVAVADAVVDGCALRSAPLAEAAVDGGAVVVAVDVDGSVPRNQCQ